MTNSTPAGLKIEYDDSGGSLVDITQHVITMNDIEIENIMEMTRTFGDAWDESKPIGVGKITTVELAGIYDDTVTTSPNALFGGRVPEAPSANTRTLKITWIASGKNTSFETHLISWKRAAARENLSKWMAKLQPTGAATEA